LKQKPREQDFFSCQFHKRLDQINDEKKINKRPQGIPSNRTDPMSVGDGNEGPQEPTSRTFQMRNAVKKTEGYFLNRRNSQEKGQKKNSCENNDAQEGAFSGIFP